MRERVEKNPEPSLGLDGMYGSASSLTWSVTPCLGVPFPFNVSAEGSVGWGLDRSGADDCDEENLLLILEIHELLRDFLPSVPPPSFSELLRLSRPGRLDVDLAAGGVGEDVMGTAFVALFAGSESAWGVTGPGK